MNKISVVISAFNESTKIDKTLRSVRWADEVIFIDNESTDDTVKIAKKYTKYIFSRPNNPMLNVNKNYGFTKATGDWILSLDADEQPDEDLVTSIRELLQKDSVESAFQIPRKNIIFGKWIEHTGWYPDYQIRLFKKGSGKFAEKHVHEMVTVNGIIGTMPLGNLIHHNYETVSQFISKLNHYTDNEAKNLLSSGYVFNRTDCLRKPVDEFFNRYIQKKGYQDNLHGLFLSLLMAFYYLIVYLKVWEQNGFKSDTDNGDILKKEINNAAVKYQYWNLTKKIDSATNPITKFILRLYRKLVKMSL